MHKFYVILRVNRQFYSQSCRHRTLPWSAIDTSTETMHARAGALMFPSSCLDGGITRVGPGQYPQYTRADFGPEAVGSSNHKQDTSPNVKPFGRVKSRMVAEPAVTTDPRAVSPRFSHQQSGGQSSRATCCPFPFPWCGRSRGS